jgi:hypothetical protein
MWWGGATNEQEQDENQNEAKANRGRKSNRFGFLMAVMDYYKILVGLNGQESDGWVVRLQEEDEENGGRPRVLMFEVG